MGKSIFKVCLYYIIHRERERERQRERERERERERRTFIWLGTAVQNPIFGMTSFPSAFLTNFMISAPTIKYTNNREKNLKKKYIIKFFNKCSN